MNRPGERVGPYELVELIAARPLANLWRAERVDTNSREPRVVVLRIAHHTMDTRAMSELRREYDTLRAVDDPRVRKAYGFYAGFGALALEFVDGATLRAVVEHAQAGLVEVDLATLTDMVLELANALRSVHERGVVHGRLCVDTVRLRRDGGVVLTDFALPVERMAVVAPEMKSGAGPTAATDQWLLGAMVVHLVTRQALLGAEPGEQADGRRDLRPWIEGVSTVDPGLGRIVARMLARDARDRYPDLGPLVRELLALLRGFPQRPDRERLGRRMSGRPAPPPAPMPPPTPVLAPAPPRREVRMRPLPESARTLPPEAFERLAPRPADPATDLELPDLPPTAAPRGSAPGAPFDDSATVIRTAAAEPPPPPGGGLAAATTDVGAGPPRARPTPAPLVRPQPVPLAPRVEPEPGEPAPAPRAAPVPRAAPSVAPRELPRVPAPPPVLAPELADTVLASEGWTPAPNLIDAVHEEVASPAAAAPPPVYRAVEPEAPAPSGGRMVPDWAAAVALILLLGVGLWAILSRIF